jgi:hypothetical protein
MMDAAFGKHMEAFPESDDDLVTVMVTWKTVRLTVTTAVMPVPTMERMC